MYGTQPVGAGIGPVQAQCQPGLPTEPARSSELQTQINTLNNNLEYLEKAIGSLGQRLMPLMAPANPGEANKNVQASMSTDVGKLLQQYNNRLELLIGVLGEITKRLEI